MPDEMNRREAMMRVGLAGLVGAIASELAGEAATSGQAAREAQRASHAPATTRAFTFFTPAEVVFVEAAVERLIPTDELGPGGRDAGCAYFIDQQLAGAFGAAARWYMQGPFGDATAEQGYQLPLTPRQLYRRGIEHVNTRCTATFGRTFDKLGPTEQDAVLGALEEGRFDPGHANERTFFAMLLANTIEGFFADPIYGGNRDKAGWRLVGFPGVAAAYVVEVEDYNKPYRVEPVSIADIVQGQAELDDHGHPIHRALAPEP